MGYLLGQVCIIIQMIIMLKNILFDLDGTLTDSQEGVIKCFQQAVKEINQKHIEEADIKPLIGIPIRSIFGRLLETEETDLIARAINIYRQRFSETGIFQNTIYPGVIELLNVLNQESYRICIVTLKNQPDAEIIARHFSFDSLVSGIFGPDLTEYPENKSGMIKSVLNQLTLSPDETVMIGDRKEDVLSGKANGVRTIGVTYGYGSTEELIDASPDHICNDTSEIQKAIESLRA